MLRPPDNLLLHSKAGREDKAGIPPEKNLALDMKQYSFFHSLFARFDVSGSI